MGPEHLKNNELSRPAEYSEKNIINMESERPVFSETPHLYGSADEIREAFKGNVDDSERAQTELPQLKYQDVESCYYSTYGERIGQTPREDSDRGEWSGGRGESDFTPNDKKMQDVLEQYDKKCITYENAIPDFSEVSEATVEIGHMTENRAENFRQCDEKCAEQWNQNEYEGRTDWTARDVKEWRQEKGYSWHERNDMKTCDLVPTTVNDYFGHLGGVSECKKRDMENGGSDFDE